MRRVCAWCGEDLAGSADPAASPGPITHGICQTCRNRLLGRPAGTPLEEFLASLEIPILMVDQEGRVQEATPAALGLVEKTREGVVGQLGGDVFSCVNADLPGGCGKTENCPACTVRNTVTETYQTGESRFRVSAVLTVRRDGSTRDLRFLLSTMKVGDRVLVQVEPEEQEKSRR